VKGVSILEVMTHHLLSFCAARYHSTGDPIWRAMMIAHRALHFAVPVFLFLSSLLLARSLAKTDRPDWRRFYTRRALRTAVPYLIWTGIYLAFRLRFLNVARETAPVFVGSVRLPALLLDAGEWRASLLWGKAYFHLYFMSVLLQLSLAFPILFALVRRLSPSWRVVALAAVGAQLLAFVVNARLLAPILGFATPASSILWYLLPALVGVWYGLNWERRSETWMEHGPMMLFVAASGFAVYMRAEIGMLDGTEANSMTYNASLALFTGFMGPILLVAAERLKRTKIGPWLARIGSWSLPLFLIHPMALYFTGAPRFQAVMHSVPFPTLVTGAAMFAVTWGATWGLMRLGVDKALFGRSLRSASGD